MQTMFASQAKRGSGVAGQGLLDVAKRAIWARVQIID